MGLTSWTGALPKRTDAAIAKNYLSSEHWHELEELIDELDLIPTTLRIADPI